MAWSYRKDAADEVYVNEPGPITFDPDVLGGGGGGGSSIENNVTQLLVGQGFIDVVFSAVQPSADWVLVQCQVVNVVDPNARNIWIGTMINKTELGFRVLLSGLPDTVNYYLHWAISHISLAPGAASTYLFTGPSSGIEDVNSAPFTVSLLENTVIPAPITITPGDGGDGGVFTPVEVVLDSDTSSGTFVYRPDSPGIKSINVTNDGGLTNPSGLSYVASALIATTYTLAGPSSGRINTPSTNFTVALPTGSTIPAPVTVTPHDGGAGGTFTPTSVNLSTGSPIAMFTYTPASYGAKTISVTNSGTLTNPANLTYTPLSGMYTLTGPSGGFVNVSSTNFVVALPVGGEVVGTVIVTPNAGGSGSFTPAAVTLSTAVPTATFVYTPVTPGTKIISVTNNGGLTNPGSLDYVVVAPATAYTLTGPTGGDNGEPSTPFTVTLVGGGVPAPVTVTPSAGAGGGTFTPASVELTTAVPSATFTYTPTTLGAKTISCSDNGGLADPSPLIYTVVIPTLNDGDLVSLWLDSSGNGKNATATGVTRPTFKTAIVNGKPIVRFVEGNSLNLASSISGDWIWVVFAVMRVSNPTDALTALIGSAIYAPNWYGPGPYLLNQDHAGYWLCTPPALGGFHIFTITTVDLATKNISIDGTAVGVSTGGTSAVGDFTNLGSAAAGGGDMAEVLIYKTTAIFADPHGVEKHLGNKYGISVPAGTAIDPASISGLAGWWKADTL